MFDYKSAQQEVDDIKDQLKTVEKQKEEDEKRKKEEAAAEKDAKKGDAATDSTKKDDGKDSAKADTESATKGEVAALMLQHDVFIGNI